MNIPPNKLEELNLAFLEIQQARPNYVLENMVVNSKFTNEQQYAQCVLEMSIAYDNLRIAECNVELKKIEIEELNTDNPKDQLNKKIKEVELEQTNRARLWSLREFTYLYWLWEKFPKQYTREDLNNAQELEYKLRLETQANQDLNATWRISQWNQEWLRQIWRAVYPLLDVSREVEQRYLEWAGWRMLIAVATEHKAEKWLPCIEWLDIPSWIQYQVYNCHWRKVADAYNDIIQKAINDKVDILVTIEDDTFWPPDWIVRLLETLKNNPKSCVWGWYPKREASKQGVHIELKDWIRQATPCDWTIRKLYTLAMWFTIYPIEALLSIDYPYTVTTENLSQDSYLSQKLREANWTLLCDTSIKCKHICRNTWEVFE